MCQSIVSYSVCHNSLLSAFLRYNFFCQPEWETLWGADNYLVKIFRYMDPIEEF